MELNPGVLDLNGLPFEFKLRSLKALGIRYMVVTVKIEPCMVCYVFRSDSIQIEFNLP